MVDFKDEEKAKLSSLPTRLEDALDTLEMAKSPHPAEFDKYFNL